MKRDIEVRINLELLEDPYSRGKGLGKIYVKIGEDYFPEENWDDFMFMVLSEWSYALTKMIKEKENEGVLEFVDGSLAIKLSRITPEVCTAYLGGWDKVEQIVDIIYTVEIDFMTFCTQVDQANKKVIDYMESNQYDSLYFKAVKKWGNELGALIATYQ